MSCISIHHICRRRPSATVVESDILKIGLLTKTSIACECFHLPLYRKGRLSWTQWCSLFCSTPHCMLIKILGCRNAHCMYTNTVYLRPCVYIFTEVLRTRKRKGRQEVTEHLIKIEVMVRYSSFCWVLQKCYHLGWFYIGHMLVKQCHTTQWFLLDSS